MEFCSRKGLTLELLTGSFWRSNILCSNVGMFFFWGELEPEMYGTGFGHPERSVDGSQPQGVMSGNYSSLGWSTRKAI